MKKLLAAGALLASLAFAAPLSLAQTTTPPSSTTTTTSTSPVTAPTAPSSTSSSTSTTTPLPAGGSQTTTTTTSTTTTPGSCRTRHSAGEACSCLSAPTTMGTAATQNGRNVCVVPAAPAQ